MTAKLVVATGHISDHYQLSLAFYETNLLLRLVTDLYFPADRKWFSSTISRLIGSENVLKRYHPSLGSERVSGDWRALAYFLLTRITKDPKYNSAKDSAIGRAARRLANHYAAPLLCYSYYAYEAFKDGPDRPPYRFLFQVHPHPLSVRKILVEELDRVPAARASLLQEPDLRLQNEQFDKLTREPSLANGWMVASSFTKQTLVEHGIPRDHVHVVPYGVDTSAFVRRPEPPDDPFTIIFVGQMIQRKGLSYLLDAVRLLKTRRIRLVLCGRGYIDRQLLEQYDDLSIDARVNLPFAQLLNQLHRSHLFVLPSLVEGFGHVVVEAMAVGLPVIVTPHTGGLDLVTDGKEGFIVPIRSAAAIAEKIVWAIEHPRELTQMGENAADRARQQTWNSFREGTVEAYKKMLNHIGQ